MPININSLKKNYVYIIILIVGLAALISGGIAIWHFSKKQTNSSVAGVNDNQNMPGRNGGNWGQGSSRDNFKPLHGTIQSIDESSKTIVMKADDGSSKNIVCSDSTRIMKQDNGQRVNLTLADLKVNDEINVMSTDDSQTNIQARAIFIGTFTRPQDNGSGFQGNYNNT
jgi:hypothetical protein